MSSYVGRQAETLWGAAGSTATTPLTIVEQDSIKIENAVVEGNFRKSRRTNHRPGQQKITGSITLERELTDPGFIAFKAAVKNGSIIALVFKPVTGDTTDRIDGDFMVSNLTKETPIGGWQVVNFDYALNEDQRAVSID